MPGPLDTAILIQQMPSVQKLTHAEQSKPEAFQRLLGNAVDQTRDKVQEVVKNKSGDAVHREKDRESGHGNAPHQEARERDPDHQPEEEENTKPSPWSGNFINLRI